jgi:putative FmdB family regulatory protein
MPTYDYECKKCGYVFEENLKIADRKIPTEERCRFPTCGGEVKQIIIKAAGFAYDNIPSPGHPKKPPGWYTDKIKDMKRNIPGNTL